jgi:hypothetical protein
MSNTVRLSDIFDARVFLDLPPVDGPEKTAFYESGIVVSNPLFNAIAGGPGKTADLPFWRDIDADDAPNLSDDTNNVGNTSKIVQGEQVGRKSFLNRGFRETDLAAELATGGDALARIRARIDTYWRRQWQRRLIASCNGVLASNLLAANAGFQTGYGTTGDMVFDATDATYAADRLFTRENFTAAAFTLGDSYNTVSAIAVHSVIYKRMIDNDDIDFIPDSQGQMTIPTYLGHRVIVDDSLPVKFADSQTPNEYTSIIFGAGAFGFGEGSAKVPVEVDREPEKGRGGGIETLWSRKTYLLHPFGYSHMTATPYDTVSFTLTELATGATWTRVVERKNVPIAFLITN